MLTTIALVLSCTSTEPVDTVDTVGLDNVRADPDGATIAFDRPSSSLSIDHATLGREGDPRTVPGTRAPQFTSDGITYDHGDFVTRFIDHPSGVEQTFDIHTEPSGEGALRLSLRLSSEGPLVTVDGGVGRVEGGLIVARYDGLLAFDATGRELPAHMAAECDGHRCDVDLMIDDTDAIYPLWIDPLVWAPTLTATGAAGLGRAVAVDDDWAVVATDTELRFYQRLLAGWTLQDTQSVSGVTSIGLNTANGIAVVTDGSSDPTVYSLTGTTWGSVGTNLTCGTGVASFVALDGAATALRLGLSCELAGTTTHTLQEQNIGGLFLPASVTLPVVGAAVGLDFSDGLLSGLTSSGGVATVAGLHELLGTTTQALATDATGLGGREGEVFVSTPTATLTYLHDITGLTAGQSLSASAAVAVDGNAALLSSAGSTTALATSLAAQGWADHQTALPGGTAVALSGTFGVIGSPSTDTVVFVELALNTDVDGDGFDAVEDGGDDCDDGDGDINPGEDEVFGNGIDEDCDGLDADLGIDTLVAGDLVLTEVMASPNSVGSVEWLELANLSGGPVDLLGLQLDVGGTTHTLSTMTPVPANGRVVLSAAGATDYTPDAVLAGLSIPSPVGLVEVRAGATTLDSQTLTNDFGTPIGASRSLDPDETANRAVARSWCDGWASMPSGDFGTPGLVNEDCDPTLSFEFHWTFADTTEYDASTTLSVRLNGRFHTGNGGSGTVSRSTDATGQTLTWTYDGTGVTYLGVRPFGVDSWCNHAMSTLPPEALSGQWGEAACP